MPQTYYDALEREQMKPYLSPETVHLNGQMLTRKADKTGLISFKANKYSVPLVYQRGHIGIDATGDQLHLYDLETSEEVAVHTLTTGKGKIIKNTHHYRDPAVRIDQLEQRLQSLVGMTAAEALCQSLKLTSPRIYKDQLSGVNDLIKAHYPIEASLLEKLCQRPDLTATMVRDYLQAYADHPDRLHPESDDSISTGALQCFAAIRTQEAAHEQL